MGTLKYKHVVLTEQRKKMHIVSPRGSSLLGIPKCRILSQKFLAPINYNTMLKYRDGHVNIKSLLIV